MTLNKLLLNLIEKETDVFILTYLEDAYKSDDYIYKLEIILKYGEK